ncbi:HEAT repeat domain-containing protein [Verrucomicrobiales bacterium BCK34]|nr:HEAT repeat domain-containing protein [Verrucomicrobiales bacterium BCK34]
MKPPFLRLLATFAMLFACTFSPAITPEELESRFKQLPTVPEAELPEMSNEPTSFRGLIEHEGLEGNTWVSFPFVENPGSFGFDPKGRLFVAEANRFWLGVPDLRGANELIRDDFKAVALEDRTKLYEKYASSFPEGWFSRVADRIIRLEDKDGNGAADHRTLFSDRFKEPLDGIGFSILADDGHVYFTCIPSVWKLTDTDDDGIADKDEEISTGYGVRVSFIGHDLHGIIRGPDGMLYFSVGDRGYDITDGKGKSHQGDGKGAIFRCESDGSGLEIYADGLRNPQELAFDNYGNLFTFDNTGDIGDKARMVYAIDGTDSGWNMAHQSPHHYATHLDWGDFRPKLSMWVKERMFDTYNEEQPQWVYPPAAHLANGPSGVTYLTGNSLPDDLRDQFLLANYRGPSDRCTVLTVKVAPEGAGYTTTAVEELFKGVGASDVELGFDGAIYLCDFGGGWSVNENGSIQVAKSKKAKEQAAGAAVAALFKEGFDQRSPQDLEQMLNHPDRRVRQAAQFALVKKGDSGAKILTTTATNGETLHSRLHALWGLGQLTRSGTDHSETLLSLLEDLDPEIRANAARVIGDTGITSAKTALIDLLTKDKSLRVKSLGAIALSRIGEKGDPGISNALFEAIRENGKESKDIVLRHALLTGIDRIAATGDIAAKASSESSEERLVSVIALRRRESPEASKFLDDSDPLIVREAVRAIYDTAAADTEAGDLVSAFGKKTASLPEAVQRRVVANNYRRGTTQHAKQLLELAAMSELELPVRKAALIGLKMWDAGIETDPVNGHYRPLAETENNDRSLATLATAIGPDLKAFLKAPNDSELVTLGMELATLAGVQLDPATLTAQVANKALGPELRVAVLDSLVKSKADSTVEIVTTLLSDEDAMIRVAAFSHGFALELEGLADKAKAAIKSDNFIVARAALEGISKTDLPQIETYWKEREKQLRRGLWLDAYLILSAAGNADAAAYAAADPGNVFALSLEGGNQGAGEIVFQNQGACLQCHKIGGNGGVQGPDLTQVATRLTREKILESVTVPGAEITEGYGMTSITLNSGDAVVGRISNEADDHLTVVGLDNKPTRVERSNIKAIAPPVSAMPPVAMALPPKDLRDLVAYLAGRTGGGKKKDDASHGDDEKIAK